jgi:hypothetical protein
MWNKKNLEDLYNHYQELDPDEQADTLKELWQKNSQLDLEWIEMIEDAMDGLLPMDKPEKVEELVNMYSNIFPGEYEREYEFVEKNLITYYLYKGNLQKAHERLKIVWNNPVKGIDTVTIPALYQLIYYGHYETALQHSHSVWKLIADSDEVIGLSHAPFCGTIYLNALEEAYLKIKNGGTIDWKELMIEMGKFDIREDEEDYRMICHTLESQLSGDEIRNLIKKKKHESVNLQLNIQFLKYLKDKFNIPFMLGDLWWNMLTPKKLYKNKPDEEYFYMDYEVLDKHFAEHFDESLLSNSTEMFGKAWGLHYPYYFLKESGLINEEEYARMFENIEGVKYFFSKYNDEILWRMSFVFNWPQIYPVNPSIMEAFHYTFAWDPEAFEDKVGNYLESQYNAFPLRIRDFIKQDKFNDLPFPLLNDLDDEDPELPFLF